jgi:hypothetical protein
VGILFEWNSLVFFLIHLLVWFLLDYLLIKLIQGCHVQDQGCHVQDCHVRNSYSSVDACNSCRLSDGLSLKSDVTTTKTKSQHLTGIMKMNSTRGHKQNGNCNCCSSLSLGGHFDSSSVSGGVSSHSIKTADSFHQPSSSHQHLHLSSRHHHQHPNVLGVPGRAFPVPKFDFLIAWLFREFMALYLFVKAISTNKVTWRTGSYRLDWGGTATAADARPNMVENL